MEDRRRRFSEDVVDPGTKDIVRIQKMFREMQRQVNTNQMIKVTVSMRYKYEVTVSMRYKYEVTVSTRYKP